MRQLLTATPLILILATIRVNTACGQIPPQHRPAPWLDYSKTAYAIEVIPSPGPPAAQVPDRIELWGDLCCLFLRPTQDGLDAAFTSDRAARVPVWEHSESHGLQIGHTIHNESALPIPIRGVNWPLWARLRPDGSWTVTIGRMAVSAHGILPPGGSFHLGPSDFAGVHFDSQPLPDRPTARGCAAQTTFTHLTPTDILPSGLSAPQVNGAVQRAVDRLNQLICANDFNMNFTISFDPALPFGALSTFPAPVVPFPGFVNTLLFLAEDSVADPFQTSLYENLPVTSQLPVYLDPPSISVPWNVGDVSVPLPLYFKLYGTVPATQPSIAFKLGLLYDADRSTGIPSTHFDLEAMALHELLHIHGFSCEEDVMGADSVLPLDLFRLDWAFSQNITAATFQQLPRMLHLGHTLLNPEPGTRAALCTAILQPVLTYEMSHGWEADQKYFQAGHWREKSYTNNVYIGLMHPTGTPGPIPEEPLEEPPGWSSDYLYYADVRALDIVGWDIDQLNLPFQRAGNPSLIVPAEDEIVPNGSILINWSVEPAGSSSAVFLFAGAFGLDSDSIYTVQGWVMTS